MNNNQRIDVHQHVLPPFYADSMGDHGGDPSGSHTPQWSAAAAIEFMEATSIAAGILSLSTPSVVGWDGGQRRTMARRVNEFTAAAVADNPDRFGNFATLPMPDVEGALQEIAYAFDTLRADGVVLITSYGETFLGDQQFEAVWDELGRRHAVVFVHPGRVPGQSPHPTARGVASPLVDFPSDTTQAAVQLVLNGTLTRHPGVRVILAHAGGFLPYAANRFTELGPVFRSDVATTEELLAGFHNFYFDTALSTGYPIPTLTEFAGIEKILFGSDFPYAPAAVGRSFAHRLDTDAQLTAEQLAAINRDSALTLFPRLAA